MAVAEDTTAAFVCPSKNALATLVMCTTSNIGSLALSAMEKQAPVSQRSAHRLRQKSLSKLGMYTFVQ